MKSNILKILFLFCFALFLNGCKTEGSSLNLNTEEELVFIDPVIKEKGLLVEYLDILNIITFNKLQSYYYFVDYGDNAAEVKKLSIEEISTHYDYLILAFKVMNYQKSELDKDISLIGYKPSDYEVKKLITKHKLMVLLVGQLHNEMLRKTADKKGLLDGSTLDLKNKTEISKLETKLNSLKLNKDDLIKIIDIHFLELNNVDAYRPDIYMAVSSHLGHDLLKLRLHSMKEDDTELPKVQDQLRMVLKVKDNFIKYLNRVYL